MGCITSFTQLSIIKGEIQNRRDLKTHIVWDIYCFLISAISRWNCQEINHITVKWWCTLITCKSSNSPLAHKWQYCHLVVRGLGCSPTKRKKKPEVASVLFSSELTLRQTHFYYKQMRALTWFDDVHQSPSTHFKSSINIMTVFFNVLFVIGYSQSSETWRYHFNRCDDNSLCPERAARLIKSGIKTNNTQNIIICPRLNQIPLGSSTLCVMTNNNSTAVMWLQWG